jgi:hypothetical protein
MNIHNLTHIRQFDSNIWNICKCILVDSLDHITKGQVVGHVHQHLYRIFNKHKQFQNHYNVFWTIRIFCWINDLSTKFAFIRLLLVVPTQANDIGYKFKNHKSVLWTYNVSFSGIYLRFLQVMCWVLVKHLNINVLPFDILLYRWDCCSCFPPF